MSDLHPEELHDAYREDALVGEDARRYEDHLEHCRSCAAERRLWDDFETYLAPREGDDARIDRLVLGVLERDDENDAPLALAPALSSRRRVALRATALTLACVLAAAAAAAALSELAGGRHEAPAPVRPMALPETVAPVGKIDRAAPLSSSSASEDAPKTLPKAASAAELFSSANAARRAGHYDEAIGHYRELQRRYPDSREAKASRVMLGRLLLERKGDPQAALEQFDGYIDEEPAALTEEAVVSRALALEKLGRRDEERAAWQLLLSKYPTSVHAPRARQRLSELE